MSHHHLSHLDNPPSAPSTPSPPHPGYAQPYMTGMSQQQNTSQSRQPTSYPSPHSYPSPSMSAYAYPAPQQQQNVEPYRASPTGSHVSLPSLNLPPIRSIDPRQPQQQQVGMGSPLPPPGGQVPAYYGQQHQNLPPPGHQHPNVTSSPHHQGMRYQLPNDSRIMSGGRHKKEIKRRTKTGCLTCRKRRIKCDEAHPVCRNCQKSKRDCMGYDPIFRSQPSGPAAIQPAPSSAPTTGGQPAPYYQSSASGGYAPPLSTGNSSPASSAEPFDYNPAIDPALEAAAPPQMSVPPPTYEGTQPYRPEVKGEGGSPFSNATSDTQPRGVVSISYDPLSLDIPSHLVGHAHKHYMQLVRDTKLHLTPAQGPARKRGLGEHPNLLPLSLDAPHQISISQAAPHPTTADDLTIIAKGITIDDYLAAGGAVPPSQPSAGTNGTTTLDPIIQDELLLAYRTKYAPALDEFLDSTWYSTKGWAFVLRDHDLCKLFADRLEAGILVQRDPSDETAQFHDMHFEMLLAWGFLKLALRAVAKPETNTELKDLPQLESYKVQIIEALIADHTIEFDSVLVFPPQKHGVKKPDGENKAHDEFRFWITLGQFCNLDFRKQQYEITHKLRDAFDHLHKQENRDILWSLAWIRFLKNFHTGFPHHNMAPENNDPNVPINRLFVAKLAIEKTAVHGDRNIVARELCRIAVRSWEVQSRRDRGEDLGILA